MNKGDPKKLHQQCKTQSHVNNSRLQSFFKDVMEERDDTLILPSFSSSTGLACFRKFLYSSVCRGVSLKHNKSSAVQQKPCSIYTEYSFQLSFSSYSTDSLELPPRLLVEYCCLPELEKKPAETAQPRALLYTAAQSSPAGWQNHHLWVVASGGKSNILSMATISFLEESSHHKN